MESRSKSGQHLIGAPSSSPKFVLKSPFGSPWKTRDIKKELSNEPSLNNSPVRHFTTGELRMYGGHSVTKVYSVSDNFSVSILAVFYMFLKSLNLVLRYSNKKAIKASVNSNSETKKSRANFKFGIVSTWDVLLSCYILDS